MGMKAWSAPWRLHSKGLELDTEMDLTLTEKVQAWSLLLTPLILLQFLICLVIEKVSL